MLEEITTPLVFTYLLIFCRIGSVFIMLPGVAEGYVLPRARLILALGLSLTLLPILGKNFPPIPTSAIALALLIGKEVLIGLFIGSIVRIIFSALHTAGIIIATQTGLASAMLFDPTQGEQSSSIGVFLTMCGLMLVFTTNLHHLFILGIVESYNLFLPVQSLNIEDMTHLVSKTTVESFNIAVKISAPILVIGIIVYLGSGIISWLMPQILVFFIITPIQILLGFFIFMLLASQTLTWFTNYYAEIISNFIK